jgi:molecular chaperone Hsp33
MADENGVIGVDCAFCSKVFPVRLSDFVSPPL